MFIPTKKPKVRARPPLEKLLTNKPLHWTEHAKYKMKQYGLSPARVKRVLRFPVRTEAGIAPKTVAVMQPQGSGHSESASWRMKNPVPTRSGSFAESSPTSASGLRMTKKGKWSQEIWVMYQDTKKERKIIAAWRYPGVSPVRQPPPFPQDLMA